jgi:hypothetical protein
MIELIAPAKLVVYVAGPYRAKNGRTVDDNIAAARKIAIALWEAGHVALCPHLNTANFEDDSDLPDETYLDGDLQLLLRCDAIVMQPNWEESEGAIRERKFAEDNGTPVYEFPELPPLSIL